MTDRSLVVPLIKGQLLLQLYLSIWQTPVIVNNGLTPFCTKNTIWKSSQRRCSVTEWDCTIIYQSITYQSLVGKIMSVNSQTCYFWTSAKDCHNLSVHLCFVSVNLPPLWKSQLCNWLDAKVAIMKTLDAILPPKGHDVHKVKQSIWICTRIDSSSDDAAKRVPRPVIKPVVESVESFICQEPCCPIVEVRIKLMNNALKAQHGEQTCWESCKEKICKYYLYFFLDIF